MRKEDFVKITREHIKICEKLIRLGDCSNVTVCSKCPFGVNNSTEKLHCLKNGYATIKLLPGEKDYKLIKSAKDFIENFNDYVQKENGIMSLDEAINHSFEKANDESLCEECRKEHKQLAEWLCELKKYREG